MDQEKVWNEIADLWNSYRYKEIAEITEFLKNKKGRVLDLGCGSGRNLIQNENIEYYGVDFSEKMLKFAEQNAKNKKVNAVFFKSDVGKENLPFEDNFFDAALFMSTLHCIETAEERKKALEELYRVMKKNSDAMISVWNKEKSKKLEKIPAKEGYAIWRKDGVHYERYYYFYSKEELEDLLKRIGFKIMSIETKEGKTLMSQHSQKNLVVYVKK